MNKQETDRPATSSSLALVFGRRTPSRLGMREPVAASAIAGTAGNGGPAGAAGSGLHDAARPGTTGDAGTTGRPATGCSSTGSGRHHRHARGTTGTARHDRHRRARPAPRARPAARGTTGAARHRPAARGTTGAAGTTGRRAAAAAAPARAARAAPRRSRTCCVTSASGRALLEDGHARPKPRAGTATVTVNDTTARSEVGRLRRLVQRDGLELPDHAGDADAGPDVALQRHGWRQLHVGTHSHGRERLRHEPLHLTTTRAPTSGPEQRGSQSSRPRTLRSPCSRSPGTARS